MVLRRIWRGLIDRMTAGGSRTQVRSRRCRPLLEALEDRTVPTNFFVSTAGNDVVGGGATGSPFRSVQFAINQAQSGDRIHVAGGTYGYNAAADQLSGFLGINAVLEISDKSLQLFGGFDNAFTTRSASTPTIIDGGGAMRDLFVLGANAGVSLTMDAFTLQNGAAHGEPKLSGSDTTFAFGGGMFINTAAQQNTSGPFTLSNITFQNNSATGNNTGGTGGSGAGGALALRFVNGVNLQSVKFLGNVSQGGTGTTKGGDALGAGIHADHSTVTGSNLTFTNNKSIAGASSGSGKDGAGTTADGLGAAAAIQIQSTANFTNVTASGNSVTGGGAAGGQAGSGFGGAFFVEAGTLNLTDATVVANTARGGDGQNGGLSGGGGIESLNSTVGLNRVKVVSNISSGGIGTAKAGSPGGGGLYLTRFDGGGSTVTLNNTLVADNIAQFAGGGDTSVGGGGGGIWLQGVAATINQSTIANNRLDPALNLGQAILMLNDGATQPTTATISFSIVANHTNGNKAPALDVRLIPGAGRNVVTLNNVLFANNTKDNNTDSQPDQAGTFNGLNTVVSAADAGFVSAGAPNQNYHLVATSPAVNAATGSNATVDADNLLRDSKPDLGAFEFGATKSASPMPPPPPSGGGGSVNVPGSSTPGVFDPATGIWYLKNSNGAGAPDIAPFAFGAPGWIPLIGDWDGNGTQTIGVFDPATATFYLKNSNGPGGPDITPFQFGAPGWKPVVGDWTGTGIWSIGVVDPATGTWYLRSSNTPGGPDVGQFAYGAGAWTPVAGNWAGCTCGFGIGMFDPATGTFYLRNEASAGGTDAGQFAFGGAGWKPVVGDWNATGKDKIGVFDPNGSWYLRNSNTSGGPDIGPFSYGAGNWSPVAGNYIGSKAPMALMAADGEVMRAQQAALSQGQLQAFYEATLGTLQSAGVSGNVLARLGAAQVQVGHFGDGHLGSESGNRIVIDDDAAGHGWFSDPTPGATPPAGQMDLLTTVLHEMGHVVGLPDLDPLLYPDQLMTGTLPAGVRRAAIDAFL